MKGTQADLNWLADPKVFAVNRLNAYSDHSYYLDIDKALNGDAMELKQSLNGRWYFIMLKILMKDFLIFIKRILIVIILI